MSANNNLAKIRVLRDFSQRELAKRSDIAAATVCLIETGKTFPQDRTKKRLAEALGCSINEIFPRDTILLTKREIINLILSCRSWSGKRIEELVDEYFDKKTR